jgi:transposase InsO family protein
MTDNGAGYVARLFRKVLRFLGIRHIRTRPYTPKTNGKAERFIQRMLREWAYATPSHLPIEEPLICRGGSPGTMNDGLVLASPVQHPLRLSPEQPDQKPHLGRCAVFLPVD